MHLFLKQTSRKPLPNSHNQINRSINFSTQINIFLQIEQMVFVVVHQLFFVPHFLSKEVLTNGSGRIIEKRWILIQRKEISGPACFLQRCQADPTPWKQCASLKAAFPITSHCLSAGSNLSHTMLSNILQIRVAYDPMIFFFMFRAPNVRYTPLVPLLFWHGYTLLIMWLMPPQVNRCLPSNILHLFPVSLDCSWDWKKGPASRVQIFFFTLKFRHIGKL